MEIKGELKKIRNDETPVNITIARSQVKEVHSFQYLGLRFISNVLCDDDVKSTL